MRPSPLNVFANHLLVGFQTRVLYLLRNYELFVWFSDMFADQEGEVSAILMLFDSLSSLQAINNLKYGHPILIKKYTNKKNCIWN